MTARSSRIAQRLASVAVSAKLHSLTPNRLVSSLISSMTTTLVTPGLAGIPRGTDLWGGGATLLGHSSVGRMRPAS